MRESRNGAETTINRLFQQPARPLRLLPAGRRDVLTRIYPALLKLAGIEADPGQLIR
jgi:hypothetical protein